MKLFRFQLLCLKQKHRKREIWHFFRILKLTEKVEETLVSPGRPLEDRSTGRLLVFAPTRCMLTESSVSETIARLTLAAKENCFVLSVGNHDTLPENVLQINFPPERTRERMGIPNHKKRESQAALMLKLLVETPIVRKTCN